MKRRTARADPKVATLLKRHFRNESLHELVTASRVFPMTARVDLQGALEDWFGRGGIKTQQLGIHSQYSHETLTFAFITQSDGWAPTLGPLQYDDVDAGDPVPVRCLRNALWLAARGRERFAVLLTPATTYGHASGLHVEFAAMPSPGGPDLSRRFLAEIETALSRARSYRGKVLSLERGENYSGKSAGIRIHKLRTVTRDQIVLPEATVRLLENNVDQFIRHREKLRDLRLSTKKGLLFYGPPGTGKTHTIHYLAHQLPEHTTLLITAEQVGLLDEYMRLARFLQPALIVIEDVDLIARSRTNMHGPCEESLLNKLLNEMDGLREEAHLLFILTTNRPQDLEPALAARPGRIDQAIEFPLPDDEGRRKLIRLYAGDLEIDDDLIQWLVRKTNHASAAFIKELMRRSAQFLIQAGGTGPLEPAHVEAALDEMLLSGGSLNVTLLGGAAPATE